jgi:hypothetical protein
MTDDELEEKKVELSEITQAENEKLCIWFRHILFVISTLLGILVSLHTNIPGCLYVRLCFSLSNVLFAMAIAGMLAVCYTYSAGSARSARTAYQNELLAAIREGRKLRPVGVNISKVFFLVEKASYVCIALALLLLAVYSLLIAFN